MRKKEIRELFSRTAGLVNRYLEHSSQDNIEVVLRSVAELQYLLLLEHEDQVRLTEKVVDVLMAGTGAIKRGSN